MLGPSRASSSRKAKVMKKSVETLLCKKRRVGVGIKGKGIEKGYQTPKEENKNDGWDKEIERYGGPLDGCKHVKEQKECSPMGK